MAPLDLPCIPPLTFDDSSESAIASLEFSQESAIHLDSPLYYLEASPISFPLDESSTTNFDTPLYERERIINPWNDCMSSNIFPN